MLVSISSTKPNIPITYCVRLYHKSFDNHVYQSLEFNTFEDAELFSQRLKSLVFSLYEESYNLYDKDLYSFLYMQNEVAMLFNPSVTLYHGLSFSAMVDRHSVIKSNLYREV